jgi:hypothetical protein
MEIAAIIVLAAVLALIGAWMMVRLRARHGSWGEAMRVDRVLFWVGFTLLLAGFTLVLGLVLQAQPALAPIAGLAGVVLMFVGVGVLVRLPRTR